MKKLTSLILIFAACSIGYAQEWIDVTDTYVKNPRYDNNSIADWSGTTLGQASPKENAEHYNKTYNTYQTITGLPARIYRVSLDAFYRSGDSSTDYSHYTSGNASNYQYAKLYANSNSTYSETPIVLASSGASSSRIDNYNGATSTVGGNLYIPNNMYAAYYWFNAGYYDNSIIIKVDDSKTLTIGIKKDVTISSDWTCIDNWKLEQLSGDYTKVTSIKLNANSLSLGYNESYTLSATTSPSNALYPTISWSSSNSDIVSVDTQGKITAKGKGTATITATTCDGSELSANCIVSVDYDAATASSMIINEIMSANIDQFIDPSWNYGGWIELYNPTAKAAIIGGYWVSDDPSNLKKVQINSNVGSIPAKGYRNLWFEHTEVSKDADAGYVNTQLDMKLDCDGGTIYISDSEGNLITKQSYPASIARCSYARTTDGGDEWKYTSTASPEASNNGSSFSSQRLDAPVVDTEGKMLKSGETFSFNVTIPSGTTLKYTTDGSTPSATNGNTSDNGSFTVNATTVYRFCLVENGYLPSPVVTRSFIYKNHDYYLPVISVVTNPDNLYDSTIGAYTKGSNGKTGNGRSDNCNWNMDWERPVNMEYLVPDDQGEYCVVLNQECNFEVCGGWTRAYWGGTIDNRYWEMQGSFRLKCDKMYEGINSLDYPVFPNKPYNKYKTWQVRNGGNDYNRIIDPALNQIVLRSGFNVDAQDCQPAHIFFNGEYLGMLNIRESNNKHYGLSNYGIDTDDMDQFDLSNAQYNQKVGDDEAWLKLVELSAQLASNNSSSTYSEICKLLDIDEYCNYMALECFIGSSDWITNTNNVKGFRSRSDDGKFHFVFFDADAAYSNSNMTESLINTGGGANVDDLFRNLIKYEPFKRQFIDAFCIVDGSVLDPDKSSAIISEMYNRANTALGFEGKSSSTSLSSTISNSHNSSRISNMKSYFGLGSAYNVTLSANTDAAQLMLNGQEIPYAQLSGSLFAPITLTAKAPAGYKFKGWNQSGYSSAGQENTNYIFEKKSIWYYYDQGSLDDYDWKASDFNPSEYAFNEGTAPFGYAKSGYYMDTNKKTSLDYGGNSNNKRLTNYFIKHFDLEQEPNSDDNFYVSYEVDDGLRIYVNGYFVDSYHCEGSYYSYYTKSSNGSWYESNDPATGVFTIPNNYLQKGENVIAVEVHNCDATSSDTYFDANLYKVTTSEEESSYISTDETFSLSNFESAGTYTISAEFEPIAETASRYEDGGTPIRINEVSAGNDININEYYKKEDWVELYNTTDESIDIAGMYLSDNSNKPQKYQISAEGTECSTIIPAHGRKIIWCDKMDTSSQLHAPFKLDNSDGACVSIQSADGTWADKMTYNYQSRWKTFGRYPDGGKYETLLGYPTIEKANKLGTYDYGNDTPSIWDDNKLAITLELEPGWNWISHNLAENFDKSRFTSYAKCLRSQTSELYYDEEYGWVGNMNSFDATEGYKVQMNSNAEITLRGNLYDVSNEISLNKGWNWIGVPLYNATAISAALQNYTPTEGDEIVGLDGFAIYESGSWCGNLTSLSPGQSYLLKTSQAQSFRWNSLSAISSKSRRYIAPRNEQLSPWDYDMHAYPNVMNIIGKLDVNGLDITDSNIWLGAFCCGECRGVAEEKDGLLYFTIHGSSTENIGFKLMDAEGNEYEVDQQLNMVPQNLYGSNKAPYIFTVNTTAISTPISLGSHIVSTTYCNINGQRISNPQGGICIKKTRYDNGFEKVEKINR